jgi:hypothetical protein
LPRSGDFHYQIRGRIHLNAIAVICPAIPEKLTQYYNSIAVFEFTSLFQSDSLISGEGFHGGGHVDRARVVD